jgi:signal transduction histidine kinase/CheY-like chemotaxis protein
MKHITNYIRRKAEAVMDKPGFGMRAKLITIFVAIKVIPLILLTVIAWWHFVSLGDIMREIAVSDSSEALNNSAIENIERMTTDAAQRVAAFLYDRDDDILYIAGIEPREENYREFAERRTGRVIKSNDWTLASDGKSWVAAEAPAPALAGGVSTNEENDDMDGFRYRQPETFEYEDIPLYTEITYIDTNGREQYKVVTSDRMDPQKKDVSNRLNTYVKAETYFDELQKLKPGEIYVSDVIGAYVGSNYIGVYAPEIVAEAAKTRGYDIEYAPEEQAYAGEENPNGKRFEGIVRWATPVTDAGGEIVGYVTLALNHDHIMEFVDHLTPMNERYTELPSAFEGNYAFIWDYKCRSICHPRHHSIVGFDPETGEAETPWLESSIYDAWKASGVEKWTEFVADAGVPEFDAQSRSKTPAQELTREGLVGLDGRYLNNAPQCTGWMDLTANGGSGSFYILWSGLYKLTTAAAIPYYTGHYAPSESNDYSKRGFGFVAIGAGLDDFTRPAAETETKLVNAIGKSLTNIFIQLTVITGLIIILVVFIAIKMASYLTNNITGLIKGISRFKAGERQFRFNSKRKNEFGDLADSFDDMADNIVGSVNGPLCITDLDLKIIYMNEKGLALRRRSLSEIVGVSYFDHSIYPIDSEFCPIRALREDREAEIYYLEEQDQYVKGVANYFLGKNDERIGYIVVTNDVTEMARSNLKLEQAVRDANRANRHKDEFLARMSHEIRTPMNAIIGMTSIVQRKLDEECASSDTAGIKDNMQQIEASSQHLLGLLNDILDISKLDSGTIELTKETVELRKFMSTLIGIIKPRCEEKSIGFDVVMDDFSPSTFICDSMRLRQVLVNLLGNAVKFTPARGNIEFRIERKDRRDGKTLIKFSVSDTGIGITKGFLPVIFRPFEQGDGGLSREYGGTGLGLAISRHIVQLFGGEISVRSEIGEGSEFSFEIWLQETEDLSGEEAILDATDKFADRRALLVDDVEINRVIVMSLLEITGMLIDEAEGGPEAVKMFKDSPEGMYDIVFMDVQMPLMDGYETTEAIRGLDRADARAVPIVALTANAFKEDVDKALERGMNAHIAKPVEMDKLLDVLMRFL